VDEAEAIREFLGDRPDSDQLKDWRSALQDRLTALEAEQRRAGDADPGLKSRIQTLKRQIAALQEEQAITEFVEDSVRVTLAMGTLSEQPDEEG
jgi:hypothetical protein